MCIESPSRDKVLERFVGGIQVRHWKSFPGSGQAAPKAKEAAGMSRQFPDTILVRKFALKERSFP
jgi:hypothetical protein